MIEITHLGRAAGRGAVPVDRAVVHVVCAGSVPAVLTISASGLACVLVHYESCSG